MAGFKRIGESLPAAARPGRPSKIHVVRIATFARMRPRVHDESVGAIRQDDYPGAQCRRSLRLMGSADLAVMFLCALISGYASARVEIMPSHDYHSNPAEPLTDTRARPSFNVLVRLKRTSYCTREAK